MVSPVKPVRADAVRNRELLLAAAEQEFIDHGIEASVADIASRAGVAKGTVFRHFTSKDDLIAAIVEEHMKVLTSTARRLLASEDPGGALFEFLEVTANRRRQRDVTFLLTASAGNQTVARLRDELFADVEKLVDRAREQGAIRADISGTDVFLLICAPVHVVEFLNDPPPELWRRYLGIIFDGLRPQGANPLPIPAPTWP